MKSFFLFSLLIIAVVASQAKGDDQLIGQIPTSDFKSTESDYSQLFELQGGAFSAQSVTVSNGEYKFQYDSNSLQTFVADAGWALKLFNLFGAFHFEESLDFTSIQGSAPLSIQGISQSEDLKLFLVGLDSRLMYSMEWFPWKRLIPFVDGGYRYTFYSQNGPTDLESAQGGVGNFVAGAGFRFWLNRGYFTTDDLSERYTAIPIFLTAKYNHIYSSGGDLDLGSDSYLAGFAIAL